MGQEIEFGDPEISKGFSSRSERYKGRKGYKDVICIISKPIKYISHTVDRSYMTCGKPDSRCLGCEAGLDRRQKIGCLIVHMFEKEHGKEKYDEVGEVKPWLFGGDKWNIFCDLLDSYPELREKGLIKCDFYVACADEKDAETFQKLTITPTMKKTMLTKKTKHMLQNIKEAKQSLEFFTSAPSVEQQQEILKGAGSVMGSGEGGRSNPDTYIATEVRGGETVSREEKSLIEPDNDELSDDDISGLMDETSEDDVPWDV